MQAQELSLNYHCKCEQWVHFGTGSFFNFNGTAGVWRKKCVDSIGGWNSRTTVSSSIVECQLPLQQTQAVELVFSLVVSGAMCAVMCTLPSPEATLHLWAAGLVLWHWSRPHHVMCCCGQVEDMDLSLRSYVGGWRAIFLEDTTCLNEVLCHPCRVCPVCSLIPFLPLVEAVQHWGCLISDLNLACAHCSFPLASSPTANSSIGGRVVQCSSGERQPITSGARTCPCTARWLPPPCPQAGLVPQPTLHCLIACLLQPDCHD